MHHLARRTSLVGRQPEALRMKGRGVRRQWEGNKSRRREKGKQKGIDSKVRREQVTILKMGNWM